MLQICNIESPLSPSINFSCLKKVHGDSWDLKDKNWFVFLVHGYNPPGAKGNFHYLILLPKNTILYILFDINNDQKITTFLCTIR